eukprot:jgi/Mesvir1/8874/Mv02766-RA.2
MGVARGKQVRTGLDPLHYKLVLPRPKQHTWGAAWATKTTTTTADRLRPHGNAPARLRPRDIKDEAGNGWSSRWSLGELLPGNGLLRRMLSVSVPPNRTIFNTIIKGYIKAGDLVNAEAVLGVMRSHGIPPDVASYSTVMDAWSGKGDVANMLRLFRRMTEEDELTPDTTAYSILAKGYSRAKQPHHCEALLDEMSTRWQLSPNVVTYTTVINCWCNAGHMDKAAAVFGRMRAAGIAPNYETYNTLVRGHGQSHDPRSAEAVLEMMRGSGIPPDTLTMDFVVDAWLKVGNTREAERVYHDAMAQGLKAHPPRIRKDPVNLGRKGRLPGAGAGKPGLANGPTPVKKTPGNGQNDDVGKGRAGGAPNKASPPPSSSSPSPSSSSSLSQTNSSPPQPTSSASQTKPSPSQASSAGRAGPGSQGRPAQASAQAQGRAPAARGGPQSSPPPVQGRRGTRKGMGQGQGGNDGNASRTTDATRRAGAAVGERVQGPMGQGRAGAVTNARSVVAPSGMQGRQRSPLPAERDREVQRSSLVNPGAPAASSRGPWDTNASPRNRSSAGVNGSGRGEGNWAATSPAARVAAGSNSASSVPETEERLEGREGADAALGSRVRTSAMAAQREGGSGRGEGIGYHMREHVGGAYFGRAWMIAGVWGPHGQGKFQGVSVVRKVKSARVGSRASLCWLLETGTSNRKARCGVSQASDARLALGHGERQLGAYLLQSRGLHGELSGSTPLISIGRRADQHYGKPTPVYMVRTTAVAFLRTPPVAVMGSKEACGNSQSHVRHLLAACVQHARLATACYLG